MENNHFVSTDEIRTRFSTAMSNMYGQEVPLYRNLLELVADVNAQTLQAHPQLQAQLNDSGEILRLSRWAIMICRSRGCRYMPRRSGR